MRETMLKIPSHVAISHVLDTDKIRMRDGFVSYVVINDSNVEREGVLPVYDHRPQVVEAVQSLLESHEYEQRAQLRWLLDSPGVVEVCKKSASKDADAIEYINIYACQETLQALLVAVEAAGKNTDMRYVDYETYREGLWYLECYSRSRTGVHWSSTYVALVTDDQPFVLRVGKKVIVYKFSGTEDLSPEEYMLEYGG